MEKILETQIASQIGEAFAGLKEPVQLLFFGSKENCEYCGDVRQLLEEVAAMNDKLNLAVYDLQDDADVAGKFRVDKDFRICASRSS